MDDFEVSSKIRNYKVQFHLTNEKLEEILEGHDLVIADKAIAYKLPPKLPELIQLEAAEELKDLGTVSRIVEEIGAFGLNRQSRIAVIGGGVAQDIGGFVASILMRGINWSFFPTTLLAMGDSCVGGKTSINIRAGKNLIGSFYPPGEVHVFFEFLKSLPISLRVEGLIEVVKILAVAGERPNTIGTVEELLGGENTIQDLVYRSLLAKKSIVESDERDVGKRQLLNLGHTFAHALEEASDMGIRHGVAVGVGIVAASKFATLVGHKSDQELEALIRDLLSVLPNNLAKIEWRTFQLLILRDKKWTKDIATLILPLSSGIEAWSSKVDPLLLSMVEECARDAVLETLQR